MNTKLLARLLGALLAPLLAVSAAADDPGAGHWCGTTQFGGADAVARHREWSSRMGLRAQSSGIQADDVGNVVVLRDDGSLTRAPNSVDMAGLGLRFAPDGRAYRVERADRPLGAAGGSPVVLGDDDTREMPLPFGFPFYGNSYDRVFVNSDGNLTFGAGDTASSERSLGRMTAGVPRIAPLFTDLDPSVGGSVTMLVEGDRVTFAWRSVPRFGQADKNSFEATLRADGLVEFAYSATELARGVEQGVIGIAPGQDLGGVLGVDMSNAAGQASEGAIAESFSSNDDIDTVAVARRFYETHPDEFDQLVIFTNTRVVPSGVFAYESTVKNTIGGINDGIYDHSAEFGSGGKLESVVVMDRIGKYQRDLYSRLSGDSALGILAHETGHRWLTRALFLSNGVASDLLLGRQRAHWSFYMDSDASHLEGNDIQDLGGGQFLTVADGERYSALDQYLMGLRPAEEVPAFFFVKDIPNTSDAAREESPRKGVSFNGTRVNVNIGDVLAAIGPREPSVADSPKTFRQAYILVVVGEEPDPSDVERVEGFVQQFPGFFANSTEGRMLLTTTLN